MRKLNKPGDVAEDVFLECISIVKNNGLKARLTACTDLITEAAEEFNDKVTHGQLYTIVREEMVNANVTATELGKVYTLRMAKKNTPGREIYDTLILSSANGICPLCSHREVTTIDHYLPKAQYPRLSIVPINLVPSCTDCNKTKLVNYPKLPAEETLHPYYDNIEDDVWIDATIIQSIPASIRFFINPPANKAQLLVDRVRFHFCSLALGKLYSTQAAVELININFRITKIYNDLGANGVRDYLLEAAESRSHANKNSWQTIMYKVLANDHWFCNGGFQL